MGNEECQEFQDEDKEGRNACPKAQMWDFQNDWD